MSRDYSRYSYFKPYVPVAERRENAAKRLAKLLPKGAVPAPVAAFATRTIATSFWGKAWCDHLESFSDFSNRLPRGRTYVRNGSVCHLALEPGEVNALVSGSSLYKIGIKIKPLSPAKWAAIKARCVGKVGSLIELLQGQLSNEIMNVVTDPTEGLFPQSAEITLSCSCPDWSMMCKHVAASLYGVAVRLDTQPDLLFRLRGVDHQELISMKDAVDHMTASPGSARRKTLNSASISSIFGIDLEPEPEPQQVLDEAPAPKKAGPQAGFLEKSSIQKGRSACSPAASFRAHCRGGESTAQNDGPNGKRFC